MKNHMINNYLTLYKVDEVFNKINSCNIFKIIFINKYYILI